jgi:repressor LexA
MIPGTSRGIRLPEPVGLPIVGRVAAGSPILAQEHIDDVCDLPGSFFRPRADYLLRVKGDSMINAGILDGDLLAVHKADDARDGEIVVARIDDEVTVKRLRRPRGRGRLMLLAENDAYEPIEVDLERHTFAIEGLGVGVIRRH